jgi:alpha-mannosidase
MKSALLWLVVIVAIVVPVRAQSIEGEWQSTVPVSRVDRPITLHLSDANGVLRGTLDYPDDFDFGNELQGLQFQDGKLSFRQGDIGFDGTLSADGNTLDGTFTVYNTIVAGTLKRTSAPPTRGEEAIDSLKSFTHLPADEWKFHAGDVPHGEDVNLDDSSWQTVRAGSQAPDDAVWYRRVIEVPQNLNGYDLTGTRIWFQFVAYANGPMPQIIYFNGRRVAMGNDLEPIVLFDKAQPADKVLVAVKLLHTVDRKYFAGADLKIDFTSSRPNPSDIVQQIESVALLTHDQRQNSSDVQRELEAAVDAIDLVALHHAQQQQFDDSLRQSQSALDKLKPLIQGTTVRLSGNSHIDAAWLWPWTETVGVVRDTYGTALQLMDEYPQYTFSQSAAQYSQWLVDKYPDEYKGILDRVRQGRWELVGGMWVEPDLNMPSGESLVRQLLVGQEYFKDKFGVVAKIGWNPDSFGYNWQLPQIYKKSGIDYFVTQKMAWNDTTQLPLKLFWWESPDGSKVLTYFPHDYANGIDPVRIAGDIATAQRFNPGLNEMMHLFGVGDHGGGPTRDMLDSGVHWSDDSNLVYPPVKWGTAQQFFSDVENRLDTKDSPVWNYKTLAAADTSLPAAPAGQIAIPTWDDELYLEYHRGVFTTQARHKEEMRRAETEMLDAEKISSLAWLDGASYPYGPFTEAWKKVLFNQFHDLAAGSGIGVIYKDADRDYAVVRWTANDASTRAAKRIASEVDTSTTTGVPVIVWNPLAWTRTDLVHLNVQMPSPEPNGIAVVDAKGVPLPMQVLSENAATSGYKLLVEAKDVPSMGYEVLHVEAGKRPVATDLKANELTLENSLLRVVVNSRTGCITSLFDKQTNFETIAVGGCGNELIAFKDTPKDYDAWNIDADFDKVFTKLDKADSVKLIERGPLRATIRVVRTWDKSKFVQDISLYAGLDRVDVANDIDWHETHILLKAAFPLAASSDEATFEIPYGTIERPTTRNNKIEDAKFEVPALKWADLGNAQHGFSLINNSKYGYDAKGNLLRLSLLRSPTWPDPNADRGRREFTYSLYPHAGTWKQAMTVRRGYEFNFPLSAMQVESHEGKRSAEHSFVTIGDPNVVLTAMKKADDATALILRFYEWAGTSGNVQIGVPPGATSATLTNLMEQPERSALPVVANHVTVPVHPYEIVTVRVDYPHAAAITASQ